MENDQKASRLEIKLRAMMNAGYSFERVLYVLEKDPEVTEEPKWREAVDKIYQEMTT